MYRKRWFKASCIVLIAILINVSIFTLASLRVGTYSKGGLVSIGISKAYASPGWVSPTSETLNGWGGAGLSWDGDTGTSSSYLIVKASWSPYLELYIASISCDKVQIWCNGQTTDINQIEVDVYYNGSYNNIYSGALVQGSYQEYAIGSTQDVTGMRTRLYNSKANASRIGYIHEAQFWEILGTPDITINPGSYDFGEVVKNTTPNTGNGYFTITNNSSMTIDINIKCNGWTHQTGSNDWTYGSPAGENIGFLNASSANGGTGGSGGQGLYDIEILNGSDTLLCDDVSTSTNPTFEVELNVPSSFTHGDVQRTTVTITASPS